MIKVGKTPEGVWVHIEDKVIVATFDSRQAAIDALPKTEKDDSCKHGGNIHAGSLECRALQTPKEIIKTPDGYRAYPPYEWEWGNECKLCGEWVRWTPVSTATSP